MLIAFFFFDKGIVNHNFILWYQLQRREKPQAWSFTLFAAFSQPAWCNRRAHKCLLSEPLLPCFRIANTCKTLRKYLITSCNVTERQDHLQPSSPSLFWAGIAKVALCLHFLWAYTILLLGTLQNSLVTDEIPCRDDRTQCRSSHRILTGESCALQRVRVCQEAFDPHIHATSYVMSWYFWTRKTVLTLHCIQVCIQNGCSFKPQNFLPSALPTL